MSGFDYAWLFGNTGIKNYSVTAPGYLVVLGDNSAQSFENPPKNNHGVTAQISRILSGSDSMKCKHKNITHRKGKKLPPPRKEYIFPQMYGKIDHAAQCYNSCAFTKAIYLIIEI